MTESMRRAIDETDRRRRKQTAYNAAHGITPIGVTKRVKDIIEGVYDHDARITSYNVCYTKLLRESSTSVVPP